MKLQTLDEVEHSIGGRPRLQNSKVRIDFYVSQEDVETLRELAERKGFSLSQLVRSITRNYLDQL